MESQTKHIVKPTMSTPVQNNQKKIEQTSGNTQQFLFKINISSIKIGCWLQI